MSGVSFCQLIYIWGLFIIKMKKRGEIKLLGWNLTLVLLEVVLFVGLGLFIYSNLEGLGLYEDMYAKKISILIDNSMPGTVIELNMEEGADVALEYNFFPEVSVINNEVLVRLSPKKTSGHRARYYSDYAVKFEYLKSQEVLRIIIEDGE